MIDPTLSGVEGHLVRACPLCLGDTVRASCPTLGTLREELLNERSDVYECPTCAGVTRAPCVLDEAG